MSSAYPLTPGYVYFVAPVGGGPIKIGFSGNPTNRMAGLISWSPVPLELLAFAPGFACDEKATQNLFLAQHQRNEWFQPSAALLALIDRVKSDGKLPEECRGVRETKHLIRHGKKRAKYLDKPRARERSADPRGWWYVNDCKAIIAKLLPIQICSAFSDKELALAVGVPALTDMLHSDGPYFTDAEFAKIEAFIARNAAEAKSA